MNFKKMIKDTMTIAWLKSIPDLKRQPMMVVLLVGFAAIPLFFMMMFGGAEMLDIGLIGVIVSSISGTCLGELTFANAEIAASRCSRVCAAET